MEGKAYNSCERKEFPPTWLKLPNTRQKLFKKKKEKKKKSMIVLYENLLIDIKFTSFLMF
jgi:DNA-directed RNA polymerase delta subunit